MRYFLALAEMRNFGRAAARLHMAQPPLTRQIRALEEDLGVALFVRNAKGVELTAAGTALLDEIPNVLLLADRAKEKAQRAAVGLAGMLRVGVFGSAVLQAIPLMLTSFHSQRPDVQIELHNMTKDEQIRALRERRILVGFNRLVPDEEDLAVEVVYREGLLVALHESHPLSVKAELTAEDLEDLPMILYPNLPLPGLAQRVIETFRREGVRLCVSQEVEDVLTCVALVASGFGACITTASAASLRPPGIVYRPFKSRFLTDIELSCLYMRAESSPVLHAFLGVVREFARSQAPFAAPSERP
jgi:DNA-binding transcriptional LysR family regulator